MMLGMLAGLLIGPDRHMAIIHEEYENIYTCV